MSGAELRQAAETLRGLASGQPLGKSDTACAWDSGHGLQREDGSWIVWTPQTYAEDERRDYAYGAAYFATMHPGVGLALADWLDQCADRLDKGHHTGSRHSHRIARLINGSAS